MVTFTIYSQQLNNPKNISFVEDEKSYSDIRSFKDDTDAVKIPIGYALLAFSDTNYRGKVAYREASESEQTLYLNWEIGIPKSMIFFKLVTEQDRKQMWIDAGSTQQIPKYILNMKTSKKYINNEIIRIKNSIADIDRILFYGSNKSLWRDSAVISPSLLSSIWLENSCILPTDEKDRIKIYNDYVQNVSTNKTDPYMFLNQERKQCLEYSNDNDDIIYSNSQIGLKFENTNLFIDCAGNNCNLAKCMDDGLTNSKCWGSIFNINKLDSTTDNKILPNDEIYLRSNDNNINNTIKTLDCWTGQCVLSDGIGYDNKIKPNWVGSIFKIVPKDSSKTVIRSGDFVRLMARDTADTKNYKDLNLDCHNTETVKSCLKSPATRYFQILKKTALTFKDCDTNNDQQKWILNDDNTIRPYKFKNKCIINNNLSDCNDNSPRFDLSSNKIKIIDKDQCITDLRDGSNSFVMNPCSDSTKNNQFNILQIQEVKTTEQIRKDIKNLSLSTKKEDMIKCYGEDNKIWPGVSKIEYEDRIWKNAGCITFAPFDPAITPTIRRDKLREEAKKYATSTQDDELTKCYGSDKTKWPAYIEKYDLKSDSSPLIIPQKTIDASLTTSITDSSVLRKIANDNLDILNRYQEFNINSDVGIKSGLNKILEKTPLKQGCCLKKQDDKDAFYVSVRKPLSKTTTDPVLKKADFEFTTINVPNNSCPINLYQGSPDCDVFYSVYCANAAEEFKRKFPQSDYDKFIQFAPECACYAPNTPTQQAMPSGVPPKCYKQGCEFTTKQAYTDPTSRTSACQLTFCSSIVNAAGLSAGGAATIKPEIKQMCGQNSQEQDGTSTTPPALPSPTTTPTAPTVTPSSNITPTIPSTPVTPSPKPNTPTSTTPTTTESSNIGIYVLICIAVVVLLCVIIYLWRRRSSNVMPQYYVPKQPFYGQYNRM